MFLRFIYVIPCIRTSFCLCEWVIEYMEVPCFVYLIIQLIDVWVALDLGLLWMIILWTFMHKFLSEHMFWVLLELPNHMATLCLTFWGTSKITAFISYEIQSEKWHTPAVRDRPHLFLVGDWVVALIWGCFYKRGRGEGPFEKLFWWEEK